MSIISICATAIVATILTLSIKKYNKELALLISIGSSVVILLAVIEYAVTTVDAVTTILAQANINSDYVVVLLKVLGICFITEFTCDCAKEAGLDSLSGNIALGGKILVIVTAMPLFTDILGIVTNLVGGNIDA